MPSSKPAGKTAKVFSFRDAWRATRDSLQNVMTGLGTRHDKSVYSRYLLSILDDEQLEAAYRGDWMARKIVDIPAEDATREWRSWQADKDQITAIEAEEKKHGLLHKTMEAMTYARLYGGAALVLGVGDDDASKPLRPETVKQGGLRFVHACPRTELAPGTINTDLLSPFYGQPEYYGVHSAHSSSVQVHPSRVIRFTGARVPRAALSVGGWGDSIIQVVDDAVKQAAQSSASLATMMQEATLDVIRIPDFLSSVGTDDYESTIIERFQLAQTAKSVVNALVLDKDEEWQRINTQLSGMDAIVKLYLLIVSGAADIPVTRFLGQSPAGLNSTGEADLRNYYDGVASDQKTQMTPLLGPLDEVLIRSALGDRPEEIFYEWNPLWQLTASEKADIATKQAQAYQVDATYGSLPPEVLQEARNNQLIESGLYPGLEIILEDYDSEFESLEEPDEVEPPEVAPPVGEPANENNPVSLRTGTGDARSVFRRLRRRAKIRRVLGTDARPRTLYVRRDVLNGDEIRAWAKSQGLESALPADDMHVTVLYSHTPVDWIAMGEDWGPEGDAGFEVAEGGPRMVERFGEGALVLQFSSSRLCWRHEGMIHRGATSKYPEYQPHVTITYRAPEGLDVDALVPYRGKIVLGPEIFEEIDPNRKREGDIEEKPL